MGLAQAESDASEQSDQESEIQWDNMSEVAMDEVEAGNFEIEQAAVPVLEDGPALLPEPAPVETLLSLQELLGEFQGGVYVVHRTWRTWMARICIACLKVINGDDAEQATKNMAAFLMLPGVMTAMRGRKSRTVVTFLRDVAAHAHPAECILAEAHRLKALQTHEARKWRAPTRIDLNKKLEARLFEGRVGAAKQVLDSMHELENGAVFSEPMDLEEVKKKIGKLNPAARLDDTQPLRKTDIFPAPVEGGDAAGLVLETKEIMTDIFPPPVEGGDAAGLVLETKEIMTDIFPPPVEGGDAVGLVLETKEIMTGIRRLPKDTCTGSSGWSNRAIMALLLAEEEVQTLVEEITCLFNRSLSGAVADGVVALWSTGRAALIPKPDGSWRPLGMGECWYRLMSRVVS